MSRQEHIQKKQSTTPTKSSVQRKGNDEELSALGAQRARTNPQSLTPAQVVQLQRTIGNQAVQRMMGAPGRVVQRNGPDEDEQPGSQPGLEIEAPDLRAEGESPEGVAQQGVLEEEGG